ncbi:MAG: helix-turn-helix transcriptional regulator [Lachnospiraceae bacterium]|nr:helix-turn-helix transcriptional regulator [Lachnospiraceae bacterium]
MNENQLGENIARLRKEKGLSQEKVAEYMEVSRQAVTKWESNISNPSSANLIRLAELLDVSVDVLLGKNEPEDINTSNDTKKSDNIKMSKAPWLFICLSVICIIGYIVISSLFNIFSFGTLICMFIICFPIQLFIHIYFSNAVNNDSFSGIAGFDGKTEYNYNEVKKMLEQIDLNIGMHSFVCVFLLSVINCVDTSIGWLNGLLILGYVLNFILTILINNYTAINEIYYNEEDKKKAIKSIPVTIVYILLLFLGIGITVAIFEMKNIENNSVEALKVCGYLLGGMLAATIGFFVENNNINKWKSDEKIYRVNKLIIVCFIMCLVLYGFMCII